MSRYISFTNALGREYVFTRILSLTGFDFSPVSHVTLTSSGQDGASYKTTYLQPRDLSISFDVYATSASIEAARQNIITKLSPKTGLGTLRYADGARDVSISCVTDGITFTKQNTKIYSCLVRFKAFDAFFVDSAISTAELKFVRKMLIFPVTFPAVFGQRTNVGTITNGGDAVAPVIIRFYGGVTSPTFYNRTTGEYIAIRGTIPQDTTLEINTAFGVKSIYLIRGGERQNAFSMLDPRSTLWSLQPGANQIEYVAEADNPDSYGELIYSNRYMGV